MCVLLFPTSMISLWRARIEIVELKRMEKKELQPKWRATKTKTANLWKERLNRAKEKVLFWQINANLLHFFFQSSVKANSNFWSWKMELLFVQRKMSFASMRDEMVFSHGNRYSNERSGQLVIDSTWRAVSFTKCEPHSLCVGWMVNLSFLTICLCFPSPSLIHTHTHKHTRSSCVRMRSRRFAVFSFVTQHRMLN